MKKKLSKVFALLAALTMVLAMSSSAFAAYNPGEYSVKGDVDGTELAKYLVVDDNAAIPNATFYFTVASGTAVAATSTTMEVKAGPNPDSVKINFTETNSSNSGQGGKVTFTAGEDATAQNAIDAGYNTGKIAAKKSLNLCFEDITFTAPGVYRYIVTEATPTAPISALDSPKTTVDVYVNDVDGALEVADYVAYEGEVTAAPKNTDSDTAAAGTKDDKFKNGLDSQKLTVSKTVTGNQGDKKKQFNFTITISGVTEGTVVYDNASTPNSYTAGSAGTITITKQLAHGESVVITGIPTGATYTVVETEANQGGYTTSGEVKTATALNADTTVEVTNTRGGVIPTGLITSIVPAIILIAGALLLLARRRGSDEA